MRDGKGTPDYKMRNLKNRVLCLAALAASVIFVCAAILEQNQVRKAKNSFGVYYGVSLEYDKLKILEKEQKALENQIAAWSEEEGIFENIDTGANASGMFLKIMGNKELVFPDMLLSGSYVLSDDYAGCMISSRMAETLFGSVQVVGEEMKSDGKSYVVRGILKSRRFFAAVSGDKQRDYQQVLLDNTDGKMTASTAKSILYEKLGAEPAAFMESGLYGALARAACMVPVWTAFFMLWIFLYRCTAPRGTGILLKILLAVLGFAAAQKLAALTFTFSADYLPSMWSDFEFWQSLLREKLTDYQKLQRWVLSLRDMQILQHMRDAVYFAAAAVVSLLFFRYSLSEFAGTAKRGDK